MENKNIVMIKHHFLKVINLDNAVYKNQLPDIKDYVVIDVTQRDKEYGKKLSPMVLGPITTYDGKICKIFEEFYQTSKVYPAMVTNGELNERYYSWIDRCYQMDLTTNTARELRHPQYNEHPESPNKHYEHSDCIFAVYYDEKKKELVKTTSYVETRKKIYIPGYAKLVVKTDAYKQLKSLVDQGKKIALIDFDAYNFYSDEVKTKEYEKYLKKCKENNVTPKRTLQDYLNIKTMKDVINCPFLLAGHGFVIKMLLQGDISVNEDGSVNDPNGYLD